MEKAEQGTTVTKKTKVRCGVLNCDVTSSTHPEYSFYSVPKSNRRDIWLKAIKAPPIAETTRIPVCEKHFEKKYIHFNRTRRRLTRWAVPTLFLPDQKCVSLFANNDDLPDSEGVSLDSDSAGLNDDEEIPEEIHEEKIMVSNFSVTSDHIHPSIDKVTTLMPVKVEPIDPEAPSTSSSTYVIPVKRKQNESVENTGPTKVVKIKQEKNDLSVFVDEDSEAEYHEDTVIAKQLQDLAEFQNQQNVEVKEKSPKQKYTTEYKMCALELYFKSPDSYRLFQRTFSLPKISTLYRLCIPAATDLNQDVLTALGIKVNSMTEAQKECVVCVATMRLTPHIEYDAVNDKMFGFQELDGVQTLEPARSILVIAVRGLFHNWKQALGFLLLSHFQNRLDVNRFIDEVIRKLTHEIKLNVRVLMTDLQSDMSSASWNRRFDVTSPFFFIGKKKIYYMYEPLNLMKNVRDYLMHNSIVFYNGMVALWLHLVQCYEYDRKKKLMRLAPKLSQDHVIFKKKKEAKDDLKYTADVFSRATATAIATCIDLKVLDTQAKDTALWILTMSQLLDILNFSTIDPPEDRSAVYSGTTKQVEFLVEMITMFSNLQTSNASFKEGFMVTINALLLLYEELKTEYKDCLPIIGLSHDCLNMFFNKCRDVLVVPPTAKQVVTTMTKLPIFNIFQYSLNKRSPGDLEMFLSLVRQMPDIDNMYEERAEPFVDSFAATSAEFPSVPLTQDKKLEHLALYLLYKGYREHCECERMKAYVRSKDIIENLNNVMPLVGYNTQISGGKFKMVPEEFVAFLEALEVKFKEYFKENRLARSIAGLMSFIQSVTFEMPCECFPLDYIKRLYLGYRLYNVIEYNNKMFRKVTENCEAAFVVNDL